MKSFGKEANGRSGTMRKTENENTRARPGTMRKTENENRRPRREAMRETENENRRAWSAGELVLLGTVLAMVSGVCLWNRGFDLRVQRIGTAKEQIMEFRKAVWTYYHDTGSFPPANEGLTALVSNPGSDAWRGPYLFSDRVPRDPWGREYVLVGSRPGNGRYRILSFGPDGRPGTADDIELSLGEPGRRAGRNGPCLAGTASGTAGNA
jgi:general secretion pathway protein G